MFDRCLALLVGVGLTIAVMCICRPSVDLNIPLLSGSTRDYPFDQFTSGLQLYIRTDINNSDFQEPIPLFVTFDGEAQGLYFTPSFSNPESDKPTLVEISIGVHRTALAIFFCIFAIVIMWAFAIVMVILTLQYAVHKRQIEPPILTASVALLFALPALRNVQPGVPPIGCSSDLLGFFWDMTIIAICTVAIFLMYVLRWWPPKKTITGRRKGTGTAEKTMSEAEAQVDEEDAKPLPNSSLAMKMAGNEGSKGERLTIENRPLI